MPMSMLLSIIAIILIAIFFITSADSATFVLGMQSTNGSLNPPNTVKLTWGIAQAAVAIILLSANGLTALQNALIIAALPFSFIIILMMVSLYKALDKERKEMGLMVRPYSKRRGNNRRKAKTEPSLSLGFFFMFFNLFRRLSHINALKVELT